MNIKIGGRNMVDFDKTDKLIPISKLESILEDGDIFRKFILEFDHSEELFEDIPKQEYIQALNQYMKFYIKLGVDLPRRYFDIMNYINTVHQIEEQYDYEEYLDKTERIIPVSFLEDILTKNEILEKFFNFDENRDLFPQNLDEYLSSLMNLVNYYIENNMPMPPNMDSNFRKIKSVYIFGFHHNEKLEGEFELKNIDKELEETIFKRVNVNADSFTLARAIYMELCRITSYDANYYAYQKVDKEGKIAQSIYNKPTEEVTLKNNKLVCKSFSEIYATLLNKVGIKAIVTGGHHKYTLFLCNGIVVKADATMTGSNIGEEFNLPDIIRVKLNLPTTGFSAYNNENNLSYVIEKADKENEEYQERKLTELENRYRQIRNLENRKNLSFEEAISYLESIKAGKLVDLEYTEYLKILLKLNLNRNQLKNIRFCTCFEKQSEVYYPIFIVDGTEYITGEFPYFLFSEGNGLNCLSVSELKEKQNGGQLLIMNDEFKRNLEVKHVGTFK